MWIALPVFLASICITVAYSVDSRPTWSSASCTTRNDILSYIVYEHNLVLDCTFIPVPMLYHQNRNDTLKIFVRRIRRTLSHQPKIAVWLIQGGPGEDSNAMLDQMLELVELYDGEVEAYTLDHRGVGLSDHAPCSVSDIRKCVEDLNHPKAYTVTNAAHDLYFLLKKLNLSFHQQVYLYGASYGTYLVERYLTIYPDTVQGVILDGVLSQAGPEKDQLAAFDKPRADLAGKYLLADCKKDFFCSTILQDPEHELRKLYQRLDDGKCSKFFQHFYGEPTLTFTSSDIKQQLVSLLRDDQYLSVLKLIHRSRACEEFDSPSNVVSAVRRTLIDVERPSKSFSPTLYSIITFSELWTRPTPTKFDLKKQYQDALFDIELVELVEMYCSLSGWADPNCGDGSPKASLLYEPDEYFDKVAQVPVDGGVLMLHGRYDSRLPLDSAQRQYEMMSGNRALIIFDHLGHGILQDSELRGSDITCGMHLFKSFIDNQANIFKINDTCVAKVNEQFSFHDNSW